MKPRRFEETKKESTDNRKKRRNEQTRRWTEARRTSSATNSEFGTLDVTELGVHVVGAFTRELGEQLGKTALEKLGVTVEGGAIALTIGEMAYHFFDAVGNAHDANSRETIKGGIRQGLNTIVGDYADLKSPYNKEKFYERVKKEHTAAEEGHPLEVAQLKVENTKGYESQRKQGIELACDGVNAVLEKVKNESPADRRAALKAFVFTVNAALVSDQQ